MNARYAVLACSGMLSLIALGCSSKNSDSLFSGSSAGAGGASASGGSGSPTGGASGAATGGAGTAGGASGAATGGAGTAGSTGSTGGTGTGGAAGSTGGAGTGGAAGSTSGGSSGGGAGGAAGAAGSSAGAAGMAGSAPTTGCGATLWPPGGASAPQSLDVTDNKGTVTSRQFYISLPAGYDGTKAYPLVTVWHYAGGTAQQLISSSFGGAFYGVQKGFPDAIYVAGQGLVDTGATMMTGWPNSNGQDVAFTKAMLAWLESNYCIDQNRIMATGMSYGGIMSNTLACQMPDVFRAVGVMSGALFNFGGSGCVNHTVAAWITHGTDDMTVTFANGQAARDQYLKDNGCAATTQPVDPSPCVSYDGCAAGNPVVWCPVQGEGHTIPSFAAGAIANFFKQF